MATNAKPANHGATVSSLAAPVSPKQPIILDLPYPPSLNHYWRRNANGGLRISAAGKAYRQSTILEFHRVTGLYGGKGYFREPVAVEIAVFEPKHHVADLDNLLKCLLDSMTHARVYDDDKRVKYIQMAASAGGAAPSVRVEVSAMRPIT